MKDTVELAKTVTHSTRNLPLQLNRVEADLLDTQEAIKKQVKYNMMPFRPCITA
jgi:hypothetical protein